MANPYEWSDERDDSARRYESSEEDARRAARRHAEQERMRPPGRQGGNYDAGAFDRYEGDRDRGDHRSFEAEAARVKHGIERGWRRFSHGVRQAFEEERGPAEGDPRRGGGMFGGQDRRASLFSHDDGLGGRKLGPHGGKGPSGYIRLDGRILDDISDRLTDDDRLDASDIEVKVDAGEVTLNGHVASREDKRRAEDLAESVSGVKHLQNNLRVRSPGPPAQPAAAQATAPARPAPAAFPPPRPN